MFLFDAARRRRRLPDGALSCPLLDLLTACDCELLARKKTRPGTVIPIEGRQRARPEPHAPPTVPSNALRLLLKAAKKQDPAPRTCARGRRASVPQARARPRLRAA